MKKDRTSISDLAGLPKQWVRRFGRFLETPVYFGKAPGRVRENGVVFLPVRQAVLNCGLAGIIAFKKKEEVSIPVDLPSLESLAEKVEGAGFAVFRENLSDLGESYLGGEENMALLLGYARSLKRSGPFCEIFRDRGLAEKVSRVAERLDAVDEAEKDALAENMGYLKAADVEIMLQRTEKLKDAVWCLKSEVLDNISKVERLMGGFDKDLSFSRLKKYKMINAVLNSVDRLEVRGRDSAGISFLFAMDPAEYDRFQDALYEQGNPENLSAQFHERLGKNVLLNRDITFRKSDDEGVPKVGLTFTYKVAAEIGSLGDNVGFLRKQIAADPIFHLMTAFADNNHTVAAHTRWASVGAISEANCHPVDNKCASASFKETGIIHASLNGDIDNYLDLKADYERSGGKIPGDITTDTKIIPLQVEKYYRQGHDMREAFRMAVNDFKGSHAICMHTDAAPGKLFLAQKGSGQAIFVGIAEDHYMPASEVYGFVEETQEYLKLDGEKTIQGKGGPVQGQICVLDQESPGGLAGISAMYYDGTPLELTSGDIKHTEITSRDIDRQNFPHYFLKEISEAPDSVEKTLVNRWKFSDDGKENYVVALDDFVFPYRLVEALMEDRIARIFVVGQGTAGIAASAIGDILAHYLDDPQIQVSAMKASELSGFKLPEGGGGRSMSDTLVIAISQSGTTTDTNRTVDMVKERGARTLAIVNRRDSDLTFKVDGVMYTSSGRDLEMSVASTKAFYSQIIAGALLGLYMAQIKKSQSPEFVSSEIGQLLEIPNHMRAVLSMKEMIKASADRLAVTKTYWAAVGSGPNKASSDEIRIKLSELCYKTISTDSVEDKKHIDLSSEPLIIVCAAGTGQTVIGDLIKDTAIFKAHKAAPVVIVNEGEDRFAPYAEDVFHVPRVSEHLAPILNTLVGHLWGYYAALSINDVSKFLDVFRRQMQSTIDGFTSRGKDIYEVFLEKSFREQIGKFNREFRKMMGDQRFPPGMGLKRAADLSLLLKYLSGRLPLTDFEIDFGLKGTPFNVVDLFFRCMGDAINAMARPVDAIKHQAKTVTVGTSRIVSEKRETGLLFDVLAEHGFTSAQLTPSNIIVLRNVQEIVSSIKGQILYRIGGLDQLGELTDNSTIDVMKKVGGLNKLPSRVETDNELKGTKRIIVRQKNIYIGKGRKDNRSIVVIPILSSSRARANVIEYLLLLNVGFREEVALDAKIRALGGKYEHIINIVEENSVNWKDQLLELVDMKELFGSSAEKIGEFIVSHQKLAGMQNEGAV